MAKKVVIDAGHGGKDPGTSGNGIVEKDLTLKISKYLKKRFDELGIDSSLTRDDDETLDQTTRPKRVQSFYGNGNDVIVLSNHVNSGGGDGAEIIYALRNNDTLSKKIANEFENAGQNVRKYYQRRLPSNSSKDYYYMHRNTPNNETIIIEYGFVDSTKDDVDKLKNNWEDLAEAVVKGVANYMNVPYTSNKNINNNVYTVVKGDSLWSIAKKYNTTVENLKVINNLKSNMLSIGQKLLINNQNNNINDNYYIVNKGDTLYSISKNYNTTVEKLKTINNLNSNILSVGQKLLIDSNKYTVKKGDTLYSIAKEYNTSVSKIKKDNNLSSDILHIGQVLII